MERRFDMSDFEQSLKDHADQFILIPSRRVWNGIYNNLHPGSKWPSITVAIVLLITLITIGNINNAPKPGQATKSGIFMSNEGNSKATNNKDSYSKNAIASKDSRQLMYADKGNDQNNASSGNNEININTKENKAKGISINTKRQMIAAQIETFEDNNPKDYISSSGKNISTSVEKNKPERIDAKSLTQKIFSINTITNNTQEYSIGIYGNHVDDFNSPLFLQSINTNGNSLEFKKLQNLDDAIALKETYHSIKNDLIIPVVSTSVTTSSFSISLEKNINPDQGNTGVVNSQTKNQTANIKANSHKNKKKNKNIEWTYYVTPLISTATFRGEGMEPPANNYSPITIYQSPSNNGMIYHAKLGFETGAKMTYALSKKWKFITGTNLNYSDYNITSNLLHPTFATLMLKDNTNGISYSKSYITYYGNGQSLNQVSLTNYNLQLSIPVGLQYQIWRNKNIQINIASAIEPSLVLKSQAYIISADKRYYIKDPALMRKLNLSGNFSPFITFSSKKVKWHIGPEINYQLLSTYKSSYPIKEHLIDYGIRIGISK